MVVVIEVTTGSQRSLLSSRYTYLSKPLKGLVGLDTRPTVTLYVLYGTPTPVKRCQTSYRKLGPKTRLDSSQVPTCQGSVRTPPGKHPRLWYVPLFKSTVPG